MVVIKPFIFIYQKRHSVEIRKNEEDLKDFENKNENKQQQQQRDKVIFILKETGKNEIKSVSVC